MQDKIKLLYVDDEELNLLLFEINFSKRYHVMTSADVNAGLDILKDNPDISIVISDMRMPVMNGLEFIEKAKTINPLLKFFLLTGYEITSDIQAAISAGLILKYFKKPSNLLEIVKAVDELFPKKS